MRIRTWIHAPLERFNINQQGRRDAISLTLSRFCWLSDFLWLVSKEQKSRGGNVIFGGRPVFCPTASLRFREGLEGCHSHYDLEKSMWIPWNWQSVRATEICPNIFLTTLQQNHIKETSPVSIWLTIFGSTSGSLVHNNQGLLFG